jgi:DnaJ-class molecular chaperone
MENYYNILGVHKNSSQEEIKKAYKYLALKYHPDKYGSCTEFKKINEAYQTLKDPIKASEYNKKIAFEEYIQKFLNLIISTLNKLKPIQLTIDVTLKELYDAKIKKCMVNVKRNNILEKVALYISLLNYQDEYIFKKMGDNRLTDIIIRLNIVEHEYFTVDRLFNRYDLFMDQEITLYEYYYGFKKQILFFDKNLDIDNTFENTLTHILKEKGLPYYEHGELKYGNLYIYFKVQLPKHDNLPLNDMDQLLCKYFN